MESPIFKRNLSGCKTKNVSPSIKSSTDSNATRFRGATSVEQPEFDFEPHKHYHRNEPETAAQAAESVKRASEILMARVYAALAPGHFTVSELATILKLTQPQVAKRLSDLHDKGLIRDTGIRRVGPSGRAQAVWQRNAPVS